MTACTGVEVLRKDARRRLSTFLQGSPFIPRDLCWGLRRKAELQQLQQEPEFL